MALQPSSNPAQTEIPPISKESMEITEETQVPEVVDQAVETHEKKSPQESFAELRKAKEDLERQLWQAQKEKELIEKHASAQAQARQQPEEEYDFRQLEQEEFPDGKHLSKAFGAINKKLSAYETQLQAKEVELQTLKTAVEFPDFKEVVTAENIEKYIKSDEDNLEAVQSAKIALRKVYNLIKKSAAYQADLAKKKPSPISQEQQRVDDKESKPRTSSIGVRSEAVQTAAKISNASMTRQQREALWRETQAAARR